MVLCYWITGLPAAGKTTLAEALVRALRQSERNAALLDGDELRAGLCTDLGLSDMDRSENIRRAGEVARLMAKAEIVPVCAFVSPFAVDREKVRNRFAPGAFKEIYLATPLAVCQQRDPKKLYAQALRGELRNLTGFDAPYEAPVSPEFRFDTSLVSIDEMVKTILT